MVTKKQLEKRFESHLLNTHGFQREPFWTGACANKHSVDAYTFGELHVRLDALLDHLGLIVKQTEAVPSKTVLVKKAKKATSSRSPYEPIGLPALLRKPRA